MAFRPMSYLRAMVNRAGGNRCFATSSTPKVKSFESASHETLDPNNKRRFMKAEFAPVAVALGLVVVAISLAIHTGKQKIMHLPGVYVKKKNRETIPEVVDPDDMAIEGEKYVNKSILRKVAHIQDKSPMVSNPTDRLKATQSNHRKCQ
ncbi:uncharacterized protein LOC143861256 isoform X2 [Tasmannia lanceolata]|uniref:uncharacterized protein LOC143861256 isoform X2 n=1 Tax=Tasmannia lanceolata TaxID=3420 RepID=UPI004063688E